MDTGNEDLRVEVMRFCEDAPPVEPRSGEERFITFRPFTNDFLPMTFREVSILKR